MKTVVRLASATNITWMLIALMQVLKQRCEFDYS